MIYNLYASSDEYLGMVLRIAGYYSVQQAPNNGVVYHSCLIPDATVCCARVLEFVQCGEHAFPNYYSEQGADIIVTGRLEMYMEGDNCYLHLVDAQVEKTAK